MLDFQVKNMMDRLTTIGIDEKEALLLSTVYIDEQCGYIL